MNVSDFLNRLDGVQGYDGKWTAHCPCSQNHSHGDRNRSLSIAVGDDDRILVKCHKGCTIEEITAAMSLTVADLFPDEDSGIRNPDSYNYGTRKRPKVLATNNNKSNKLDTPAILGSDFEGISGDSGDFIAHEVLVTKSNKIASTLANSFVSNQKRTMTYSALDKLYPQLGSIAAEYDYLDADGELLAKKLRYESPDGGKTFRWCRPDGHGKWLKGRGDAPHRLFVAGALEGFLYIVEGEKDALTMQTLGCNVCSAADGAGGKSKWHSEYTEQLKNEGRDIQSILILQDNDKTGQEFAQETAAAVSSVCPNVKVLDLSLVWPEIPDKGDVSDMVAQLGEEQTCTLLVELEMQTPVWTPEEAILRFAMNAKRADTFGSDTTRFLWHPYLPVGDYSVIMADGGTGKTILCCGIAAAVSTGNPLPGELPLQGGSKDVLIISGEDNGEVLKKRLEQSGANTKRIYIIDRNDSVGMNLTEGYMKFIATVQKYHPALLIIDPWHNFLGAEVDIFRVNALRPVLQKVANMARQCDCAIIMISHVNKRSQGENANNAATGSTDFINASRSAMRLIFDEDDRDRRILVHTKSNYSTYGQSVCFRIEDGGLVWDGFSNISRETLEEAARSRNTPCKVVQNQEEHEQINTALIQVLKAEADKAAPKAVRFSYEEFREKYGEQIFGTLQPKRALDSATSELSSTGYFLRPGFIKHKGKPARGFTIQYIE